MTILNQLTPFSYHVLILIAVLVIKYLVDNFVTTEPLAAFRFYCQQLSNKVNKAVNSAQQQTIAGLVAIIITLIPVIIILWLFADFVAVDYLWQGLLLYISLGRLTLAQINQTIAQAIVSKQSYLAKQTLKPWLLRETTQLSAVGLSKAAIEMYLLRSLQQTYAVAFIFITCGSLAALSYRLLLEMHYCWNTKLPQFKYFGFYSQLLVQLLQWIPSRLMALLILVSSLGKNNGLSWRLSREHFLKLNNNFILAVHGFSLAVKLGGVAMYQGEKLRKLAFNELAKQPEAQDVIKGNRQINFVIYTSLFLLTVCAISWQLIIAS